MIKVNETKMLQMIDSADLAGLKNYIMAEMTISASSSGKKKDGLKAFYKLAEKKLKLHHVNGAGVIVPENENPFISDGFWAIRYKGNIEDLRGINIRNIEHPPKINNIIDGVIEKTSEGHFVKSINIPELKTTLKRMKADKTDKKARVCIIEDQSGKKQLVNIEYLLLIDSIIDFQNGGRLWTGNKVTSPLLFSSKMENQLFEGILCPLSPHKLDQKKEILDSWK